MKPSQYLDALREKFEVKSDYAVAMRMGWTRQLASNYRNNRNTFDNMTCAQVAKALAITFDEVVADMEAQRAKTDEQKKFWENFGAELKRAVAAVFAALALITCTLFVTPNQAEAATALPSHMQMRYDGLYYVK